MKLSFIYEVVYTKNDMANYKTVLQQEKPVWIVTNKQCQHVDQHKLCNFFSKLAKSIAKQPQNCLAYDAPFKKPCSTGKGQCCMERVITSESEVSF